MMPEREERREGAAAEGGTTGVGEVFRRGRFSFQSNLGWGSLKPVSTFAFNFNNPLRIDNKTEPPPTCGGWQGPLLQ